MLFIHSSVSGHGFELWITFWPLWITLNMSVQISVQGSAFNFFWVYSQIWAFWVLWQFCASFFWGGGLPYCFLQWLQLFLSFEARHYKKLVCECVLSCSVVSDSFRPHGPQPTRLLCPWRFSRQGYWSGLPCPLPGDLPDPGIEPRSPALQEDSLPSEPPGKPKKLVHKCIRTSNSPYRNSLAVQWLGLHTFTVEGLISITDWGTKILQTVQLGQKKKISSYIYFTFWLDPLVNL